MLIPNMAGLSGYIAEVHGSHDSGKTRLVLQYIEECQKANQVFRCFYIDTGNQLRSCDGIRRLDKSRFWTIFMNDGVLMPDLLCDIGAHADLIVLDDFSFCRQNPWTLMKSLRDAARKTKAAIIVVNQKRYVLRRDWDHPDYNYQPYRFNIVSKYCRYAVDVDMGTVSRLDEELSIGCDLEDLLDVS